MNDQNSVLLEGRLTIDPILTITQSEKAVCNFPIAVNRYFKKEDVKTKEVSFFDIECWNGQAHSCDKYLYKGRGVRIVGRIKQNRWIDDEGEKHQKVRIIAERVEFMPKYSTA